MRPARIALCVLAASLAGCSGHLDVKVEVLDPVYVRTVVADAAARDECVRALLESPGTIEMNVAQIAADLQQAHKEFVDVNLKIADALKNPQEQKQLREVATEIRTDRAGIDQYYELDQYKLARQKASEAVQLARGTEPAQTTCEKMTPALAAAILEWRKVVLTKTRDVQEKLANFQSQQNVRMAYLRVLTGTDPNPTVKDAAQSADREVVRVMRTVGSPIGDGALGDSQFAYAVASIPKEKWRQEFNKAYARGLSGNVDIAVVLNEAADFSVKGMRFDATKVAQVASKVTTQSLLLAAGIAGVPVGKSSDSGSPPPTDTSGSGSAASTYTGQPDAELSAAERSLEARQALERQRASALIAIGETIARQTPNLATPEGRTSAKTVVGATVDAYNSLLVLEGYQ